MDCRTASAGPVMTFISRLKKGTINIPITWVSAEVMFLEL